MEKKLQEMENIQEKMNVDPLHDNYHDILEFAENYFNAHERSPEGKTGNYYLRASGGMVVVNRNAFVAQVRSSPR